MRARAAEIEAADGRFVASPVQDWAHGEELIEREFAVEHVASCKAINGLEIQGSNDLHVFDEAWEIGSVFRESFEDGDPEVSTACVPMAVFQMEWSELHVGRQDVLAVWRQRRIEYCGNRDIEIRRSGEFAVLGGIEGALEIFDFGTDVDPAGERIKKAFRGIEGGESGQTAKSEMNFGDCACGPNVANAQSESGIELRGIEELEKSALGIDAGDNGSNGDFFAVDEDESDDCAVFHANVLNFGVSADFRAGFASSIGNGARE